MKRISNIRFAGLLLFVAPLLLAANCKKDSEYCHTTIPFQNDSEKDVYISSSFPYSDTIYRTPIHQILSNAHWHKSLRGTVSSEVLRASLIRPNCWEILFSNTIASDTLVVFVLDGESLEHAAKVKSPVEWTDDMLLQRYDLSLPDLQRLNFQLSYPPTEAMRNMKMYPAYGKSK